MAAFCHTTFSLAFEACVKVAYEYRLFTDAGTCGAVRGLSTEDTAELRESVRIPTRAKREISVLVKCHSVALRGWCGCGSLLHRTYSFLALVRQRWIELHARDAYERLWHWIAEARSRRCWCCSWPANARERGRWGCWHIICLFLRIVVVP